MRRGVHRFRAGMTLPLPIDETFAFFADAGNLAKITPPGMGFVILTPLPIVMREGTMIDYRLRVGGVPITWKTRIARWNPPHEFVDEQLKGPYRIWVHTHRFLPLAEGTEIHDEVTYRLPLWPLGDVALPLVRRQLRSIFRYREQAIRTHLMDRRKEG